MISYFNTYLPLNLEKKVLKETYLKAKRKRNIATLYLEKKYKNVFSKNGLILIKKKMFHCTVMSQLTYFHVLPVTYF